MAKIIQFHATDSRQPGIAIFNLPMPDGSFRTYFQKGGTAAVKSILQRWKRECAAMKWLLIISLFWAIKASLIEAQEKIVQCRVLPFREAVSA